jgi:hypothetical protein
MMRITSGVAWLDAALVGAVEALLIAMCRLSIRSLGSDYRETNRYLATFFIHLSQRTCKWFSI